NRHPLPKKFTGATSTRGVRPELTVYSSCSSSRAVHLEILRAAPHERAPSRQATLAKLPAAAIPQRRGIPQHPTSYVSYTTFLGCAATTPPSRWQRAQDRPLK